MMDDATDRRFCRTRSGRCRRPASGGRGVPLGNIFDALGRKWVDVGPRLGIEVIGAGNCLSCLRGIGR